MFAEGPQSDHSRTGQTPPGPAHTGHVERFYTRVEAEGLAPATVLQIHRILSRALKVAVQRGYVAPAS